ncbi:hypothetical protein IFM89_022665, partial [Coptis chinensis]
MADGSMSPPGGGAGSHESGEQSPRSNVREQDRYLPIANISRIMKKGLPANGKIAKDAKETVQECVSEFISFITSEASDKCQREKRKTINGDDLLWAMATLGFEEYIDPLKVYLSRYREGDSKGSVKGGDGRKEAAGVQSGQSSQLTHQGSFGQGASYINSPHGDGGGSRSGKCLNSTVVVVVIVLIVRGGGDSLNRKMVVVVEVMMVVADGGGSGGGGGGGGGSGGSGGGGGGSRWWLGFSLDLKIGSCTDPINYCSNVAGSSNMTFCLEPIPEDSTIDTFTKSTDSP